MLVRINAMLDKETLKELDDMRKIDKASRSYLIRKAIKRFVLQDKLRNK